MATALPMAVDALVEGALLVGGHDNVTAIVVRVLGDGDSADDDSADDDSADDEAADDDSAAATL